MTISSPVSRIVGRCTLFLTRGVSVCSQIGLRARLSLNPSPNANGIDRVVRPIAYLMLEAHWIYWVAGITRFVLPESSTTLGDARPALGRQRTIKNWLGLFGRRSKSEKALASPRSPRSPKTIPRVATP